MKLERVNALIDAASAYIFSVENKVSQLEQQLAEKDQIIKTLKDNLETVTALSELIDNPEELKIFQNKLDQLSKFLLANQTS
jgi:Tfp pilus assembly protein PilO